jgi:eukaryotic-like serine/threonine-protein kinase
VIIINFMAFSPRKSADMINQQNIPNQSAANNLVGQKLPGGWIISRQLPRPGEAGAEDHTGSWFSIGYIASKGDKEAFLKVIDVERALAPIPGTTVMDRLKQVTDSHIFECSILDICTKAKLDRIVRIIEKGELPPPFGAMAPIPYILFELADGDVRQIVSKTNKIDDAWRLQVLHDVAVGIQQLHSQRIAHQDIKPSNVLIFDQSGKGAKIGDLGRASHEGMEANHDHFVIAGAQNYAPPEQVYGIVPEQWADRREGCDLYHLGTLAMFIFTGVTPTDHYLQALTQEIRPKGWQGNGTCDYGTALPVLTVAFTAFVESIKTDLPEWSKSEMSQIFLNACNPDYKKRGDPDARKRTGNPIGIDTFVSKFDRLAKRALIELHK